MILVTLTRHMPLPRDFYQVVQRGQELPTIVDQDMTLSDDELWIVSGPTLIEAGVSVTVTSGTQIQWGSDLPADPYEQPASPYIQVEGSLEVTGSQERPVEMFPGAQFVDPADPGSYPRANVRIFNLGTTRFRIPGSKTPSWVIAIVPAVNSIHHSLLQSDDCNSLVISTRGQGVLIVASEAIASSLITVGCPHRSWNIHYSTSIA